MSKTVIQQLIDELKKARTDSLGTYRGGDYRIGLSKAIELAEGLLKVEEEQIINAFASATFDTSKSKLTANKYYNKTFKP